MDILNTAAEVRELATKEIESRIREANARLRDIRFKGVTERVENTAELGILRHMIARCQTVLSERKGEAKQPAAPAAKAETKVPAAKKARAKK